MRDGGPTMKYLFQYPEPTGIDRDLLDGGEIIDVAVNVERSGWDGFAFTEHPAPGVRWLTQGGGHQTLDPFVALGAAAAVVELAGSDAGGGAGGAGPEAISAASAGGAGCAGQERAAAAAVGA